MLSILTMSHGSEGLPLYRRFQHEGAISKYWTGRGETFKGVRKVSNYKETSESADAIILTSSGMGGLREEIEAGGRVVFGGSRFGDFLVTEEGFSSTVEMIGDTPDLEDGLRITLTGIFADGRWLSQCL